MKLNKEKIRQELEAKQAALRERMQIRTGEITSNRVANPDRADLAQNYNLMERDSALIDRTQETLDQVEAALQRLDDGTYGKCVRCGNKIAQERLEALPYGDLCITCQKSEEQNNM